MIRQRTSVLVFRLGLIAALLLATHLMTIPLEGIPIGSVNDKLSHVIGFGGLAFLLDFSFPEPRYRFWLHKALPLLLYGFAIECVQYFLPHRRFSLLDLVADAVGIALYFAALPLVRHMPLLRRRWDNGA